jgi:hypothetical protein
MIEPDYIDKCDIILAACNITERTKTFICGIKQAIEEFPEYHPSMKQAYWIDRHYEEATRILSPDLLAAPAMRRVLQVVGNQ